MVSTYLLGGHYPQGSGLGAQDVFTGRLQVITDITWFKTLQEKVLSEPQK